MSPPSGSLVNDGTLVVAEIDSTHLDGVPTIRFEYSSDQFNWLPLDGIFRSSTPAYLQEWNLQDLPPGAYLLRARPILADSLLGAKADLISFEVNAQPEVRVQIDHSAVLPPGWVRLSALNSFDPDGSIAQFDWVFDEGGSATGPVVDHQFPRPGRYYFSTEAIDDRGGATTGHYEIVMQDVPTMGVKNSCGCAAMDVLSANAVVQPAKGALNFAPQGVSGVAPGHQETLGAYNDGLAGPPTDLPNERGSFSVVMRIQVVADLKAGSKPQLCAEGQMVKLTSGGVAWTGNLTSDPRYDSSEGKDDPYSDQDDPTKVEKGACPEDGDKWCDDGYHGGGDPEGRGKGDSDPPNKKKVYDGQKRIMWLDAPGLRSITKEQIRKGKGKYLGHFKAVVSGPSGSCQCTWDIEIEIDDKLKVTKNQISNKNCTSSKPEVPPMATMAGSSSVERSALIAVRPNPTTARSLVMYRVVRPEMVRLDLIDLAGRKRATLIEGRHQPGDYSLALDADAIYGALPPGVYFVRMMAGNARSGERVVLLSR